MNEIGPNLRVQVDHDVSAKDGVEGPFIGNGGCDRFTRSKPPGLAPRAHLPPVFLAVTSALTNAELATVARGYLGHALVGYRASRATLKTLVEISVARMRNSMPRPCASAVKRMAME